MLFACCKPRLARSATLSGSPRHLWWPRFCVGTQSTLKRSHSLADSPETRCLLQTRSFSLFPSASSSLLIAEIHRLRRSEVNSSDNSPWFVSTQGTRKNLSFPCLPVLFPHPTIRQSTIAVVMKIRKKTYLIGNEKIDESPIDKRTHCGKLSRKRYTKMADGNA